MPLADQNRPDVVGPRFDSLPDKHKDRAARLALYLLMCEGSGVVDAVLEVFAAHGASDRTAEDDTALTTALLDAAGLRESEVLAQGKHILGRNYQW